VPQERFRKLVPGVAAVALVASLVVVAQGAVATADPTGVAARYRFAELPIAMPPGYDNQPMRTIRQVNPAYQHIRSWISSVGASVAINDLTGHGRDDAMCIVDTRTDDVVVTYTPTARQQDRFTPFVLDAAPLPMDDTMAPMGCAPGDFNGDGRMDLLVTYWGRTPILFLAKANATGLSPAAYEPRELVPEVSVDGKYHGPRWNTNAVAIGDFAGHGHPDIFIGNYFPDSDVLDPHGQNNVQMNNSMSNARNGGGDHVLRWYGATAGAHPTADYVTEPDAIPYAASTGWTLAASSADLTGDGLPDLYLANDFGHDYLLHNVSTPDHIRFTVATGRRGPTTPKSFVLGNGSYKGMGVDFGDLAGNGRFDIAVSNITMPWGLEESNFVWMNQAADGAQMRHDLDSGIAPFEQQAPQLGLAWTGWSWDVKLADFTNSGNLDMVQTDGFVKGTDKNRWNWLQELAMINDNLMANPANWPNFQPGDDLSGDEVLAFYGRGPDGRYVNLSGQLGLAVPIPTRGVAIGDTTGDGALDFAVARQWGPPAFYANESPGRGDHLDLRLYRPTVDGTADAGLAATGTPAYGATVRITTADGRTQISQLDGGGGHGGKRSFDVHFGLGADAAPVTVSLSWRDNAGQLHQQTTVLAPGTHTLVLTDTAQEVPNR
jgi:hypothetical protein